MPNDKEQVTPSAKHHAGTITRALIDNRVKVIVLGVCLAFGFIYVAGRGRSLTNASMWSANVPTAFDNRIDSNAQRMLEEGRQIFRYDTFGDEVYWTDTLKLHRAIEGAKLGGVGPGVSPKTALSVGLKVDMDALPADLVEKVKKGEVNLDDPATTLALIKLDAVLGLKGTFNQNGSLKTLGLSCAVCHSTVDDAFAPGIVTGSMVGQIATLTPAPSSRCRRT